MKTLWENFLWEKKKKIGHNVIIKDYPSLAMTYFIKKKLYVFKKKTNF